jgi:hypothetical protein
VTEIRDQGKRQKAQGTRHKAKKKTAGAQNQEILRSPSVRGARQITSHA